MGEGLRRRSRSEQRRRTPKRLCRPPSWVISFHVRQAGAREGFHVHPRPEAATRDCRPGGAAHGRGR